MGELIPMKEAQVRSGLSKNTLRKLIQQRGVTLYDNPREARQKLIDAEELAAVLQPQPLRPSENQGRPT